MTGLHLRGLRSGYGAARVLHGVDLDVARGEVVALLGRNGAGRTTLARAVMGLLPWEGVIEWQGRSLQGLPPHLIARRGVAHVPEGRDIFPQLSAEQNLRLGWYPGLGGRAQEQQRLDGVYHLFPALLERRHVPGGVLSGGEQQMLALGRAWMGQPSLLLVDEPTEGLAPQVAERVWAALAQLKAQGASILLIEQRSPQALRLADRVALLGHGYTVFTGRPAELEARADLRQQWLDV